MGPDRHVFRQSPQPVLRERGRNESSARGGGRNRKLRGAPGPDHEYLIQAARQSAGAATTAIAFDYYAETTDAGDTLGARTAATVAGFATSTNDNVTYVIEIDATQLTQGYPYLVLKMTDPGAATLASAVAVLSGNRYAQAVTPTAIT